MLGFLIFLWLGEGPNEGASAAPVWRQIILGQSLAQTVTILSAIIRLTISAQAAVGTSMLAAVLLERYGVPLFHLAEFSIMRTGNTGPTMMAWKMLPSASWFFGSAKVPTALLVPLLIGALASQFTSTLLISDLNTAAVIGYPFTGVNNSLATEVNLDTLNAFPLGAMLGQAAPYTPFAEVTAPVNTTMPNDKGMSDTGVVRRAFLPVAEPERRYIRSYRGKGHVFDSREVCVRPKITASGFNIQQGLGSNASIVRGHIDPEKMTDLIVPVFWANISITDTFRDAGLSLPANCLNGSCFAGSKTFGCSVPYSDEKRMQNWLCLPTLGNLAFAVPEWGMSSGPIANFSTVYMVMRSDLASVSPIYHDDTAELVSLHETPRPQMDEWVDLEGQGLHMTLSMCFHQMTLMLADVDVSTDRDLPQPKATWRADRKEWDTKDLSSLYGLGEPGQDESVRGTYKINEISNLTSTDFTRWLVRRVATLEKNLVNGQAYTFNIFMNNVTWGYYNMAASQQAIALYNNILEKTGRPALALQTLIASWMDNYLAATLPQRDIVYPVEMSSAVYVLTPTRARGLAVVAAVTLMSVVCMLAIAVMYLLRTRHSSPGEYWLAVSQVASPETQALLRASTSLIDSAVKTELRRASASGIRGAEARDDQIIRLVGGPGEVHHLVTDRKRRQGGSRHQRSQQKG